VLADQLHTRAGRACLFGRLADAAGHPAAAIAADERRAQRLMVFPLGILDRQAVDELVEDADVVIHLAFIIMGSRAESARVNLAGSRNVFEATVAAERPRRLVYTSSVA